MEKKKILIYGANGFTARLMLPKLKKNLSCEIILAGRNREEISVLAKEHGFLFRIFSLDHAASIEKNIEDIDLLINSAGPFNKTALSLAVACIRHKCHYFDISGELEVFRTLHTLNAQATTNKVCLIPGMGFDIVPSDCLSAMLAEKVEDPESLLIAIMTKNTQASHGTLKTALLEAGISTLASRSQGIVVETSELFKDIDLHGRSISCMRAPLADLFCASLSTGIYHIDTYLALPKQIKWFLPAMGLIKKLSGRPLFNRLFSAAIERLPNGPSPEQQEKGCAYIVGELRDKAGRTLCGILKTPEPYCYTADALIKGAAYWLQHGLKPGFQTPSLAFGPNFALEVNPQTTSVQFAKL